jgi:hypothetical protein
VEAAFRVWNYQVSGWNLKVQEWENYSRRADLAHESLLSGPHNHYQNMNILLFTVHMNIFKISEATQYCAFSLQI